MVSVVLLEVTTEYTEYTEEENLTEYRRFAAYGISQKESVYGCQRHQLPWYFREIFFLVCHKKIYSGFSGIFLKILEKTRLNTFVTVQRRKNTEYRFAYGKHGNTKEVGVSDPIHRFFL